MKIRHLSAIVFCFVLGAAVCAQNANAAPLSGQDSGTGAGARGQGQRGGGMGMMGGRNLVGTVTEVAADHYTIKTDTGDIYTVHFSANTRIFKQPAGMGAGGGMGRGAGGGMGRGAGAGGNSMQQLKPTDIKVGDIVSAMGQVDATAKTVGAMAIVQVDPERAKQMREMQANYGKTWLMGKVTAIDGVKVTVMGSVDNAPHTFVADENTTFRKRRDPITLADVQVGDVVRADGSLKNGVLTATTVSVTGMPAGGAPAGPGNVQPQ
jgi:hypothetical protein